MLRAVAPFDTDSDIGSGTVALLRASKGVFLLTDKDHFLIRSLKILLVKQLFDAHQPSGTFAVVAGSKNCDLLMRTLNKMDSDDVRVIDTRRLSEDSGPTLASVRKLKECQRSVIFVRLENLEGFLASLTMADMRRLCSLSLYKCDTAPDYIQEMALSVHTMVVSLNLM